MMDEITDFLDSLLEKQIPGNDCLILLNGKQVYRRFAGFSDLEKRIPMQGSELFNIYSCSKPITCVAALQLWEKGLYRLDDELCRYMPEFENMTVHTEDGLMPAESKITIRNLFTMTAGFSYDCNSPALQRAREETNGRCPTRTVARYLAQEPLWFQPGALWSYSLCHDVLAALVEVLSGMKFEDYVKKNIFDPMGMTRSTFMLPKEDLPKIAAQYRFDPQEQKLVRLSNEIQPYKLGSEYASGGAGCVTTVEDYIRFLEGWRKCELLKPETMAEMTRAQLTEKQEEPYWSKDVYGYGLGIRCQKKTGGVADFGWGGAAGAFLAVDRECGISLFYAQHVLNSLAQPVRGQLITLARKAFC